jgi:hypothetical protein
VGGNDTQGRLSVGEFAGCSLAEIDARLEHASDDEVVTLVDDLVDRYVERLNAGQFSEAGFVSRVVIVERRDVYERAVRYTGTRWETVDAGVAPRVTGRWQGLAPLLMCENGDLPLASAFVAGMCQSEGDAADQHSLTQCMAQGSDDPLARILLLRGSSDRDLARALEAIDLQAALRGITDIGAAVARHFGTGQTLGRTVVQVEVVGPRATYVTQTVSNPDDTVVYDEAVETPTVTIRFTNHIDFARICTGEISALELVAAGKVEVEGDISVFAQVDVLRW